jgi:hypothetical protein
MASAGTRLRRGVETVRRDAERAGKHVGHSTRHGLTSATDRLKGKHSS